MPTPPMITSGTVLIEKGTALPPPFRLEGNSYPSAWTSVAHNGAGRDTRDLGRELAAAGWTLFYMAGEVTAKAWGFDRQRTVHKALEHLIAGAKRQSFNCLKIDEVAAHSFLGLPYVSISAHSCHIQQGACFTGEK